MFVNKVLLSGYIPPFKPPMAVSYMTTQYTLFGGYIPPFEPPKAVSYMTTLVHAFFGGYNTIGWNFNEIPIEDNSEPVAFLIATHRDQVDENKVSEVNKQLRTKIKNSSHLFDSDLIQFSQSEQVIFPLNTTKDKEEVDHFCSLLHKAISQDFQELKIPASWCALSLRLRKSKRKLFNYHTCFQLAQECGIKDTKEFKNVLWYLHHKVGISCIILM